MGWLEGGSGLAIFRFVNFAGNSLAGVGIIAGVAGVNEKEEGKDETDPLFRAEVDVGESVVKAGIDDIDDD